MPLLSHSMIVPKVRFPIMCVPFRSFHATVSRWYAISSRPGLPCGQVIENVKRRQSQPHGINTISYRFEDSRATMAATGEV